MKKLPAYLCAATVAAGLYPGYVSAQSTTYPGNKSTGFGGPLGNSSLTVSSSASTGLITFSITTPTNASIGNDVAFYIDSVAGGVTSTANLNDTADEGRRAISGNSATTARSLVNFASGFAADYAVAIDGGGNGNLFQLTTGDSLTYVSSANYTISNSNTVYTFSLAATSLFGAGNKSGTLRFVATLLNANDSNNGGVFRSNETIGASTSDNNATGNLAQGTLTYTGFDSFTVPATSVPEPSTYALSAVFAVCMAGGYLRRQRATSV